MTGSALSGTSLTADPPLRFAPCGLLAGDNPVAGKPRHASRCNLSLRAGAKSHLASVSPPSNVPKRHADCLDHSRSDRCSDCRARGAHGRPYLYGLAFTFAAYVLYDLARLLQWPVEGALLSGLFLLATITALVAVWALYWEGRKS